MSAISKLEKMMGVFSLPYALPHELTHLLAGYLATGHAEFDLYIFDTELKSDENGFLLSRGGEVRFPPVESRPLRVFAHLSPTAFGLLLMGLWGYSGISIDGWRMVLAVGLFFYTVPGYDDITGALGIQEAYNQT